ncbi:MAG: hypothetical protein FWB97_02655 [Oscillospiraceae bacterium]|nr:hypothetical protein [Oscillospiraceae bacterium]
MTRGGIGVGSSSIVLVFAVLCLSVFSLITFVVASNDKTLVANEARLVVGYFEADALAERIVAEILGSGTIPDSVQGIEIHTQWDSHMDAYIVFFSSPISYMLAIFVRLAVREDSYDILSWRLYNSSLWEYDARLNVWQGPPG